MWACNVISCHRSKGVSNCAGSGHSISDWNEGTVPNTRRGNECEVCGTLRAGESPQGDGGDAVYVQVPIVVIHETFSLHRDIFKCVLVDEDIPRKDGAGNDPDGFHERVTFVALRAGLIVQGCLMETVTLSLRKLIWKACSIIVRPRKW